MIVEGLFLWNPKMKEMKPNPATQTEEKLAKDREQKTIKSKRQE